MNQIGLLQKSSCCKFPDGSLLPQYAKCTKTSLLKQWFFVLPFLAHLDLMWSLGVRSGSGTSRRATRSATDTSCDSGGGGSEGSEGSGGIRSARCRRQLSPVPPPEEEGAGIGGGGSSWVDMDLFFLNAHSE